MRKAFLCFLAVLFLLDAAKTEFLKTPFLIFHYTDHLARNPKIKFVDFLAMHYWGKDIRDNDHDQDMKLPFKKISHNHMQVWFHPGIQYHPPERRLSLSCKLLFYYQEKNTSGISAKTYRPPQQAFSIS